MTRKVHISHPDNFDPYTEKYETIPTFDKCYGTATNITKSCALIELSLCLLIPSDSLITVLQLFMMEPV